MGLLKECQWVFDRLPVRIEVRSSMPELGPIGLAVRENPRRTQLLVSHALAKHVPTPPAVVLRAARALAALVIALGELGDRSLVVGMAETATGLAEFVAAELGSADFIHSTRFPVRSGLPKNVFTEAHSHAPGHSLAPTVPSFLHNRRTLIVVDDELTTARTVVNLLEVLARSTRIDRVVIACLIDARDDSSDEPLEAFGRAAGCTVEVCSLARLVVTVGKESARLAADLVRLAEPAAPATAAGGGLRFLDVDPPPRSGREGITALGLIERAGWARDAATAIQGELGPQPDRASVHVAGMEEQIALPVHIGHFLAPMLAGTVRVSSTTQSPAMVVDSPLYPLRNQLRFSDGAGERRIYNTPNGAALTVLVPDADGSVPSALLRQLPGDRLVLRWRSAR